VLRNEKSQGYHRCPRLPSNALQYRLATRLSLCNLEHHPSFERWTTACCKVSTCYSRSFRLSSPSSPTSPPFTADLLANVRASVPCYLFSSLTDRLTPLPHFRLRGSGTAVVSSTVAATPHAPIGHVCRRQGRRGRPPQDEIESITLPDTTTQVLGRPARGRHVCSGLINCHLRSFVRWVTQSVRNSHQLEYLNRTYTLELIGGVPVTTTDSSARCVSLPLYPSGTCRSATVLEYLSFSQSFEFSLSLLRHLIPLLLKMHSERSDSPLALCNIHVVFLLLKQFPCKPETEVRVILT
jgi:hypothetical protein